MLEITCYKHLKSLEINPQYEEEKFKLFNGFYPKNIKVYAKPLKGHKQTIHLIESKIRDIDYTPDFTIKNYKGYDIYIECKGFPNDRYPNVRKMFLKQLENNENNKIIFFEPQDPRDFIFMKEILSNL